MKQPSKGRTNPLIFFFFFIFFFVSLLVKSAKPTLAACSCQFAPGPGTCSADCGIYAGNNCVTDPAACSSPRTAEQCNQQKDRTWLDTFQVCADFPTFLNLVVTWGMIFAAALALIRIVVSGLQFIYASGDPKNLQDARETLTQAILGLILVLVAFMLTRLLQGSIPANWKIWFGMGS